MEKKQSWHVIVWRTFKGSTRPVMVEIGENERETGRKIKKPLCIVEYKENMGAVDQINMRDSFSKCLQKVIKWYK